MRRGGRELTEEIDSRGREIDRQRKLYENLKRKRAMRILSSQALGDLLNVNLNEGVRERRKKGGGRERRITLGIASLCER